MDFGLQAVTEPGRRFVALAERHAEELRVVAEENDRERRFPMAAFDSMHDSGFLAGCVPAPLGGLGVEAVGDFVAAMNRIGRGDGSAGLAVNMHVSQVWLLAWHWRALQAMGMPQAEPLGGYLRQIGSQRLVMYSSVAETGTDILHPRTVAVKDGATWRLSGHKHFGTGSPAAQVFQVTCRVETAEGPQFAIATVPRSVPGVAIQDNWDAMGMRASGSHDVKFEDCRLPGFAVAVLGPWGQWNEAYLAGNIVIPLGLVAVFLGIAEAARDACIASVKAQKRGTAATPPAERPSVRHAVAEIEVELAASRAILERSAAIAGRYMEEHPSGRASMAELHEVMKDFQCAKAFVGSRTVSIVDRAMTAVGGGAYLSRSPLSRLARDVRAGSFMQPFSPNEAYDYIGRVTLGQDPTVWT